MRSPGVVIGVLACALAGCGSSDSSCTPGDALDGSHAARYVALEDRLTLHAPEPLLRYEDPVPCVEHVGSFCLPDRKTERGGEYLEACSTIVLMLGFDDYGYEHEVLHHLLAANTGSADPSHSSPYWSAL